MRELKQSVRRDLESMLNTRRRLMPLPSDLPELGLSVINYGLPDFNSAHVRAAQETPSFLATVAEAIRRFEPRLTKVRVELINKPGATDRVLRFRIDAVLDVDPILDSVSFNSLFVPLRGAFEDSERRSVSDELLPYYHRELVFIRRMGAEFAEKYPKIASRLRLSAEGSQDPHVDRLIEAFAYLNARIQHKLNDDFPEITDALISVLYPHFQRPIPSMAIVQFGLDRTQAELTTGHQIDRGTTVETELVNGENCRYRTCFRHSVVALRAASGHVGQPTVHCASNRPVGAGQGRAAVVAQHVRPTVHFSKFGCDRLRFLSACHAAAEHSGALRADSQSDPAKSVLATSPAGSAAGGACRRRALSPVGFEPAEAILPYSARMFAGYRLLTEYFSFPEKFSFFDLDATDARPTCWFERPAGDLLLSEFARFRNWSARFHVTRSGSVARRSSICFRSVQTRSC